MVLPRCIAKHNMDKTECIMSAYPNKSDVELISQIITDKYSEVDPQRFEMISEEQFSSVTCDTLKNKYNDIDKYCRICIFNDDNIANRLEHEINILHYCYHNSIPNDLDIDIFKFYLIDNDEYEITITKDIFEMIKCSTNSEAIYAIVNNYCQDDDNISEEAKYITQSILNLEREYDIEVELNTLKQFDKPSPAKSDIKILDLILQDGNKKVEKKKRKKSTDKELASFKTSNKEDMDNLQIEHLFSTIKESITDQKQAEHDKERKNLIDEDIVQDEDKEVKKEKDIVSGDVDETSSMHESVETNNISTGEESHESNNPVIEQINNDNVENEDEFQNKQVESQEVEQTDEKCVEVIDYTKLLHKCIAASKVFITSNSTLVLHVVEKNSLKMPYQLDISNNDCIGFIDLIFCNNNIVKIIDSLEKLLRIIKPNELNSVEIVNVLENKNPSQIFDKWRMFITSATPEAISDYKVKRDLLIIKKFYNSFTSNIVFSEENTTLFVDEILHDCFKRKLFNKFDLKFSNNSDNQISLYICSDKSTVTDYILHSIRKVQKSHNKKPHIKIIHKEE